MDTVFHGIGGHIESMASNGKIISKQLPILSNEQSVVLTKCIEFDSPIHWIDWRVAIVNVVKLVVIDADRLVMLETVKESGQRGMEMRGFVEIE